MKTIEINNLNFKYDNNLVLKNISIFFNKGETLGLVGANGAGKTTLIRVVEKHNQYPDEIKINSEKPTKSNQAIGVIHDTPILYPYLSGIDFLTYILKLKNLYNEEILQILDKMIQNFGLKNEINKLIIDYSFGMKRKIYFIPLLIENADILLLDEPTNGLDTQSVLFLKKIIRDRETEGKTTFIASHDMNFLENQCQRVYVLNASTIDSEFLNNSESSLEEHYQNVLNGKIQS